MRALRGSRYDLSGQVRAAGCNRLAARWLPRGPLELKLGAVLSLCPLREAGGVSEKRA